MHLADTFIQSSL